MGYKDVTGAGGSKKENHLSQPRERDRIFPAGINRMAGKAEPTASEKRGTALSGSQKAWADLAFATPPAGRQPCSNHVPTAHRSPRRFCKGGALTGAAAVGGGMGIGLLGRSCSMSAVAANK